MSLRVAVVQPRYRYGDPYKQARHLSDLASTASADLYLFPENWADALTAKEALTVLGAFSELGLVVAGALYIREHDRVVSRSYVLDGGRMVNYCEKMFPSRAVGEADFLSRGSKACLVERNGVVMGVAICVDLLMPEVARMYAQMGAHLLLNPANISVDRVPLWRALVTVRAFENHLYVASANNVGKRYRDGRDVDGGSAIVDPHGNVLAEAGPGREAVIEAVIHAYECVRARERRGFLDHVGSLGIDYPRLLNADK